MAATITTATRFTSIHVRYDPIFEVIARINWKTNETTPVRASLEFGDKGETRTTQGAENLAVLQTIYASANGFQNAGGTTITPELIGFPHSTDLDDLEKYGIPNPLVDGFADLLENRPKMRGYETQELLKAKTVGGRMQVEHSVDFVSKDGTPVGANYDYPLRRWLVYQETDTQIRLVLLIPEHQAPLIDDLGNYPPIVALLAWFESIRQNGDAVGSDLTDGTTRLASFGNRDYDIPLTTSNTLRIRFSTMGYTRVNSRYLEVSFRMTRQSGTIDVDDCRDYLQETTISVPSSDVTVNTEIGDYNAIAKHQRHDIDDNRSVEYVHDAILYHGKIRRSGRLYTVPISGEWSIGLKYEELAIVNSKRVIPFVNNMNAVHFEDQSANGIIKIDNPRALVKYRGTDRKMTIHNSDSTYNVEVQDWDDNKIITLQPKDHFEFRMSLDQNGQKGRMVDEHLPNRVLQHRWTSSADWVGILFSAGYWDLWSPEFKLIPFDTGTPDHHDADAFTIFTGAIPTTAQGNINDVAIVDFIYRGITEIKLPGKLDISWFVRLVTDADVTGQVNDWNAFRLYRFPADGSDPVWITEDNSDSFGGASAETTYRVEAREVDVEKGDKIFAGLRYYGASVTWQNDVRMTDTLRTMTLKRKVNKEWTA